MPEIERHHPNAKCEECPLFERNAYCPSDGPDKADIVIVGEAPGRNEVREGTPFIGASGQLLNMVLENYGFDRNDVFVTNTVLCQPEGNDNPPADAIKACGERLHREITDREPNTILALGNFASRRILKTREGITTLRVGPPKTIEDYPGVRIIPTFHPAASLYNSGVFPDIVSDFQKISRPYVVGGWSPPDIIVTDGRDAIDRFYECLPGHDRPISVDIEIGVDKDISYTHPEQYNHLCCGIGYEDGKVLVVSESSLQREDVRNTLRNILENNRIIAHNGKFDLQGLWTTAPHAALWFDTMLASYALDERRGVHSLEYNAIERLGSPSWKHEVGHYLGDNKDYSLIPRPVLYRYNGYDVHNTYQLWKLFEDELDEELRMLHDHLVEASNMLMHVERNGVAVDVPYLDQLTEEYVDILGDLQHQLRQIVEDAAYNPNSWQQVQRVLKEVFKRKVPNTRAETLERLQDLAAAKGDTALYNFLGLHLRFKKESKSYGTYVKGTRKRLYQGRVHSTFLLHGTTTGRLSSRNPNLQNVTRGSTLRGLFVPRSDKAVLGQGDYRQAELRVICALARDSYLKSVFDADRNLHEEVGREFFGADFTKADKEKYIRAKAVVFGLSYGREAFSLAMEFGISVVEAQRYIDTFFSMIPEAAEWRQGVLDTVHSGEDLVSPFGNHRRFWLITRENKDNVEKEALAFYPQNVVSNLTLRAGIALQKSGMQDMLRIPVHDAWVFECEKDDQEEIGRHVSETMEAVAREYFTDYVRFPVDIGFGRSWGDII